MTDEDDEFERIEMENKFRLDSTRSTVVADDYFWIPIDQDTPTAGGTNNHQWSGQQQTKQGQQLAS